VSRTDPTALSLAVRIDDVCNRFEAAWKTGPPRIEDFVEGWHGEDRAALLRELALLDQDYRRKRGEASPSEDYSARFPELTGPWQTADDGADARPLVGLVVGEYEIHEERGRGGMGVVYRATDLALGREVAIKVLQDRFDPRSETARRFLAEARITAQLQHPGIPAVHRVGTLPDGRPFLAMKLIKGRTLDVLFKEGRTERLLAAFEHVCQAVAYAHDHKVIHRDLKPSNVMVGAFGEVQVMDWGLAKILTDGPKPSAVEVAPPAPAKTVITPSADSGGSETEAGSMIGTPAFMPPEQAGGETDKVDQRADVFGLGAILAVILTGKPPYVGDSDQAVQLMAVRGQLDDCLSRLDACGAEREWVALCKRCLAFAPADRPKDAGEVAAEVARLRAAAEERARTAQVEAARAATKRRWQTSTAVAVFLALLAVVAGLAVVLDVRTRERNQVRLALTTQLAERLDSNLKQLEQVVHGLAIRGQQPLLDENDLAACMGEMVLRDERIFGLTLAFEPGVVFHNPSQQAALLGSLACPQGRPLPTAAALFLPETTEYCLYVSRDGRSIRRKHMPLRYHYRQRNWFKETVRDGRPRWSPTPTTHREGDLRVGYMVPVRREGKIVGVATVDVALTDFFGKAALLGDWRGKIHPGQPERAYAFVISHTTKLWDDPWAVEPGTGVFVHHPRYKFPQRIKDLSNVRADFADLMSLILERDDKGRLVKATGMGVATDPATGKRSTFLFARLTSAEWTVVVVIDETGS
jgi:serine/threonine protein kinase